MGHRLDGQPGAVGGEAARGEMVQPDAVLEVAYGILDLGVAAMVSLQFEQLPVPSLTVPSLDLSLELAPVLINSEFSGSRYTPAAYWEGEVRATGTHQGRRVEGRGFVELVGYDPRQLELNFPAP